MTNKEIIDEINSLIELANKHNINHYMIVCSPEDYPEIKAVCYRHFPHIRAIKASAVKKDKMYLWDGMDED